MRSLKSCLPTIVVAACALCGCLPLARAQTQPKTFTITGTGSACATIQASNNSVVGITVSGTWVGTFSPTVKIYGAGPSTAKKVTPVDGTAQATITANGGYTAAIGGFTEFDLCPTAWTSGTATVQVYATPAVNIGLLAPNSGPGSGTVSNVATGAGLTGGPITGTGTISLLAALPNGETATTQAALSNDTKVSTDAYADAAVAVETSRATTAEALKAPLASPALTGTPTAPTQTAGDASTDIATDAFVAAATAAVVNVCGTGGAVAYYAVSGTLVSCDTLALTDGAGNLTATSMTTTSAGASIIRQGQGSDNSGLCATGQICDQAPTSVTKYTTTRAGAGPSAQGIKLYSALASSKTTESFVNYSTFALNASTFAVNTMPVASDATHLTNSNCTENGTDFTCSDNMRSATAAVGNNSTLIANTGFVKTAIDNAIAAVNPAVAVEAATNAILPNSPSYNNGVAGIGAFITTSTLNATLVIDGYTPILADRILVKNESGGMGASRNGVYTVTTLAAVGVAWVLTRALDYDQPSDMNNTGAIPVVNGTANASTMWLQTSTVTTVGTDAVTFAQFSVNPTTVVTQVSNAAANQVCTYTGANKVCVPASVTSSNVDSTVCSNAACGQTTTGNAAGLSPSANYIKTASGTANASTTSQQNKVLCMGFQTLSYGGTFTTLSWNVNTVDNTANLYDVGIALASSGARVCHTGAIAGTTMFPAAGLVTQAATANCVLAANTKYYVTMTSSAASPLAKLGGELQGTFQNSATACGTSASGVIPDPLTAVPADSWSQGTVAQIEIHN